MATYYIRKSGSDSNAGTSAGTAWATIGKALGASGISSGDTVYVGAGTYRETVTANLTTPTVETKVIGDVDGAQTGDVGDVIWSGYLTNDKTAPTNTVLLQVNSKNFLTFQKFIFITGGTGAAVSQNGAIAHDIKLQDCSFFCYGNAGVLNMATLTVDTASNWTVDRCRFFSIDRTAAISFTAPTSTVADYDLGILITNCFYYLATGAGVLFLQAITSGANSFKPGGVRMYNLTGVGGGISFGASFSANIPSLLMNSHLWSGSGTLLTGGTSGNLIEDYNILNAATARSNVPVGTHSVADNSYAMLTEFSQSDIVGRNTKSFMLPSAGSPLLGFGNDFGASFKASTTASHNAGGSTTLACNVPTNTRNGDLMVALVTTTGGTGATTTGPAGWTQVGSAMNQSTNVQMTVWKRVASSEPANYTWTFDSGRAVAMGIATFMDASDVDASPPAANTGNSAILTAPSLTPSGTANVLTLISSGSSGVVTADRGKLFSQGSLDATTQAYMEALSCPASVASGGRSPTQASAQNYVAFTIAILSSNNRAPVVDILNTTRPAGAPGGSTPNLTAASSAVGCFERSNAGVKETQTIKSGVTALRIDGAGYHDFDVPVNANQTTVSIFAQYNASYAGTKPQLSVVNGTEAGVANASANQAGSSGSWEQLSLTFTPTSKGRVTIRLISSSTTLAGAAYFDDYSVVT